MTEKQTYTSENEQSTAPKAASEVVSQQEIDTFNEWAASGAQRIMSEAPVEQEPTTSPRAVEYAPRESSVQNEVSPRVRRNRIVAAATGAVIGAGGIAGVGYAAHEALEPASFSEETTTYTVEPGDGIFAAAQQVEGIESVDMRDAVDHIKADPANIDVLQDGLQPGEQLIIPVSVEGYDASDK